jgi:hypothetical protein
LEQKASNPPRSFKIIRPIEAVHLIKDGNFTHMLMLTAGDIKRAYDLFIEPVAHVHGMITMKKARRALYYDNLVMDQRKQTLHTDVMHLDGQHFLITVCEPLQLVPRCTRAVEG